jgi:hypothetical protein
MCKYFEFSNAVSSGVRDVLFQFFDIFPEKWFQLKLRVNISSKLDFSGEKRRKEKRNGER